MVSAVASHQWRAAGSGVGSRDGGTKPEPDSWDEELARRREARLGGSRGPRAPSADTNPPAGEPSVSATPEPQPRRTSAGGDSSAGATREVPISSPQPEIDEASREAMQREAQGMQLFAYPTGRRFPWATVLLLASSSGATITAALYWRMRIPHAEDAADLRTRLSTFASALEFCSVSAEGLAAGEFHRLLLPSLVRAGEQPLRIVVDMVVLGCCGALLERLHGPGLVFALTGVGSAVGNAAAAFLHRSMLCSEDAGETNARGLDVTVACTSGGVTAVGAFCALRYGRWAVWPGVPVPVSWLMAPVLVAASTSALAYARHLRATPSEATSSGAAEPRESVRTRGPLGLGLAPHFEMAVALAGCEAVEEQARTECRSRQEDIVAWRAELEQEAEDAGDTPTPPDGAFWADVAGAVVAVVFVLAGRGRR